MAQVTRALGQGLFVGDYFDGEERRDIIVRVQPWETPEELDSIPLATPEAGVLPVGELVKVVRTAGPSEIRRLDRRRSVTLQVTPPPGMSLEETRAIIEERVAPVANALLLGLLAFAAIVLLWSAALWFLRADPWDVGTWYMD